MDDGQETQDGRRVRGTGMRFAYETLRDEILTLALVPGQLLDETTLAERFGLSRCPVRAGAGAVRGGGGVRPAFGGEGG